MTFNFSAFAITRFLLEIFLIGRGTKAPLNNESLDIWAIFHNLNQLFIISENILNKNCNSPSTVRHTKLIKRKFDFNVFDFDVIIIH